MEKKIFNFTKAALCVSHFLIPWLCNEVGIQPENLTRKPLVKKKNCAWGIEETTNDTNDKAHMHI